MLKGERPGQHLPPPPPPPPPPQDAQRTLLGVRGNTHTEREREREPETESLRFIAVSNSSLEPSLTTRHCHHHVHGSQKTGTSPMGGGHCGRTRHGLVLDHSLVVVVPTFTAGRRPKQQYATTNPYRQGGRHNTVVGTLSSAACNNHHHTKKLARPRGGVARSGSRDNHCHMEYHDYCDFLCNDQAPQTTILTTTPNGLSAQCHFAHESFVFLPRINRQSNLDVCFHSLASFQGIGPSSTCSLGSLSGRLVGTGSRFASMFDDCLTTLGPGPSTTHRGVDS